LLLLDYFMIAQMQQRTQRLPFKNPSEFIALWARSKNDMLSIKPAAKPFTEINNFRKQTIDQSNQIKNSNTLYRIKFC
jgi:hypothetical protein